MRRPNFRAPLFCAPAPPGKNAQNCSINFLITSAGVSGTHRAECAGHTESARQRRQRQLMPRMWRMWRMWRMRLKISGGPVRYFQLIIQAKRAECETNSGARRLRTKSAKRRSGNPDFKRRGNFFFAALKAAPTGKSEIPAEFHTKPAASLYLRAECGTRNAEGGTRSAERKARSFQLQIPPASPLRKMAPRGDNPAPAVNPKRLSYAKNDTR